MAMAMAKIAEGDSRIAAQYGVEQHSRKVVWQNSLQPSQVSDSALKILLMILRDGVTSLPITQGFPVRYSAVQYGKYGQCTE